MAAKLAACLAAMAVLVAALLYYAAGGRGDGGRGSGTGQAPERAPAPVEAVELDESGPSPASAPSPVAREATPLASEGAPVDAWRGELAGLIGRVVESDGRPVAGLRVALLEVDAGLLFDGSAIGAEAPRLELEETVTDREGRFLLGGARGSSMHGLGLDLGGPRATLRMIEHALPHGERTDIGDVVLAPFGVLTGRVVDESGAPLAGARVRAGPFPAEILQAKPYEFRSDTLVAVGSVVVGGDGPEVIEPPGWIRAALERFPVPTTYSAADGSFRLEGVALAEVVGGVDKRGHVGAPIGPVDVSSGTYDLGVLKLARGRTVRGVVEDGFGEPAVGVEVFAGAELFPGIVAFLQPCGVTDADGRFALTGVDESGQIIAVTRRAPHEAWSTAVTAKAENVLLEIQGLVELTVNVRDPAGEPLSGAELRLTPARPAGGGMGVRDALVFLPRPVHPAPVFREVEPGRYVNAEVGAGRYEVAARVGGLAPSFVAAECLASVNEVTLVCTPGLHVEVRVQDALTKAPVVGARASVMRAGAAGFSKVAVERTDADGRARLGPLAPFPEAGARTAAMPNETLLLVQHPRYSDHSARLQPGDVDARVVELLAGGTLAGRVHWGGAVPTRLYMLTLEYRGAEGFLEAFHLPRFSVTDLAGEFRVGALSPGRYGLELSERFLDKDPLGLMGTGFEPPTLHRQDFEIRNGETTEVVIDLTPTGRGATASLVGRIRVDGRPLGGAEVAVSGNEDLSVTSDGSGRFETAPFSVLGTSWITITGDVAPAGGGARRVLLHSESVQLQDGDVHEIDLDLYPLTLRVQVLDAASGAPVAGAEVLVQPKRAEGERNTQTRDQAETDAAGEAELLIMAPGEHFLTTSASGFGRASTPVEVRAEGATEPAIVRLPRAVPCAGRVQVDAFGPAGSGGIAFLNVRGDGHPNSAWAQVRSPDYTFAFDDLTEGNYRAQIYFGGRRSKDEPFVLAPGGDEDLVLTFVPADD